MELRKSGTTEMSHAAKDIRTPDGASHGVGSGELVRPPLHAACIAVGNLAGKHERLRAVLMEDQAWPLRDVLAKLVEAGEILMHQKNYDGHGWEEISTAIERGKAALLAWPNTADEQRGASNP